MPTRGVQTRERILSVAQDLFLERGYAGTSIDDIIDGSELTKGGFFYHFNSKSALGMAVLERYATKDFELFEGLSKQADALSDDPLESLLLFLELFEDYLDGLDQAPRGCIFASFLYESDHFSGEVQRFIADGFEYWGDMYARRIEAVMAVYAPREPVDARSLSQMIMCLIEGGLIISRSLHDPKVTRSASAHFRRYLSLLFQPTQH